MDGKHKGMMKEMTVGENFDGEQEMEAETQKVEKRSDFAENSV